MTVVDENERLQRLLGDEDLQIAVLQDLLLWKKGIRPGPNYANTSRPGMLRSPTRPFDSCVTPSASSAGRIMSGVRAHGTR